MSETLARIQGLASRGLIRVSDHGYDQLAADDILINEVVNGLSAATVVEDYPTAFKGPSILVLQRDSRGQAVHILWAIPAGQAEPAVLVTAYRPDPQRWTNDFTKRLTRWKDKGKQ
jgi:hypothetical protein